MFRARIVVGLMAAGTLAACSGSSGPSGAPVDASHQPPAIASGAQAAPANLAAPLLTPSDLGSTWTSIETPVIGISTPPPIDVGPKPAYVVSTNLQVQHWNGSAWTQDQNIQESATSYGSAANARRWLNLSVLQGRGACTACSLAFHQVTVDGTKVWKYANPKVVGNTQAMFAVGPLFVRLTIGAPAGTEPGVTSASDAIRLAVQQAKAPTEQ